MAKSLSISWTCSKGHTDNYRINKRGYKDCRDCHKLYNKTYYSKLGGRPRQYSSAYTWTHEWLTKNFTKDKCEDCGHDGSVNRLEWANVSGEYKHEREDFKVLCKPCHWQFDSTRGVPATI